MKILFFTPYYFPNNNACAVRNSFFLDALNEKAKCKILTATKDADYSTLFIKPLSNKSRFVFRLFFEILSGIELFFRVLFSRFDKYYFSSPNFFTVFIGATAAAILNKKYILDVRDIYPESFFKLKLINENSLIGSLVKTWVGYIYSNAQSIITVTAPLKDIINSYCDTLVTVIPNGYDENLFFRASDKLKDFTCAIHGTLGVFQNVELLENVIKRLPEVKFLVIGDGNQAELISKLNTDNLTYMPSMKYEEIGKKVNQAHIGLSFRADDETSLMSFPVKVFEYIGMNLPVISTTKNQASIDIIEKNYGSYFENNQVEDICNEILKLKSDSTYYNEKLENLQKIKSQYSRQATAEQFAKILLELH